MRERYNMVVQNNYNAITKIQIIDEQWEMLNESICQTSSAIIQIIKYNVKKKCMMEEILQLMDARSHSKQETEEYNRLNIEQIQE
uniref:Uncharacterized protein n=1 Tax=Arion vulgaris TaxID=1028688 RepID=A0A0B7BW17_9EUPU